MWLVCCLFATPQPNIRGSIILCPGSMGTGLSQLSESRSIVGVGSADSDNTQRDESYDVIRGNCSSGPIRTQLRTEKRHHCCCHAGRAKSFHGNRTFNILITYCLEIMQEAKKASKKVPSEPFQCRKRNK